MIGFYPVFTDTSKKPHNRQKKCSCQREESTFQSLKKVLLNRLASPVSVVPRKVGTGANLLSRWRREIDAQGPQAFTGSGHARDEEVARLKRELARVKRERDFLREAATFFARGST